MLAEPSSGARRGPNALSAYQYLLTEFAAVDHRTRPCWRGPARFPRPAALLGRIGRLVTSTTGRWARPQRAATDVAPASG